MTDAPAPETYFTDIEAHFAQRRGTPFILNAKDWALMKKWFDDGIPLPVVIEAIDAVFEKNETSGRRKVISSLSYCRYSVKELWDERQNLYVGGGDVAPEAAPGALLEALARTLDAHPHAAAFADRVRALATEKSVPRIEERLIELETELLDSVIASAAVEIDALRAEVAASIGPSSRLDEKTRKRTEEANLRRLVRERFGLPRLTLFG